MTLPASYLIPLWLLAHTSLFAEAPLIAFPGAEGYGRFAKGGRGGDVYHVTNLNDRGEGSLRAAVETQKKNVPRTVVFEVGGTIRLQKPLKIERISGLTLAGQTAPGGGITLRDHGIVFSKCSDIIVRYLRFRLGDETKTSEDVIHVGPEKEGCRDVIFDHLTATWGIDGIMDVYGADRFTMQWCLFGEALNDSTHHKKEPHAMLMSFRKIRGNVSIHHNLLFSSRYGDFFLAFRARALLPCKLFFDVKPAHAAWASYSNGHKSFRGRSFRTANDSRGGFTTQ